LWPSGRPSQLLLSTCSITDYCCEQNSVAKHIAFSLPSWADCSPTLCDL